MTRRFEYTARVADMRVLTISVIFSTLLMVTSVSATQDERHPEPPPITAENVTELQAVAQVAFAALGDELGAFATGWFAMDETGQRFVVRDADNRVAIINETGTVLETYALAPTEADALRPNLVDAALNAENNILAALYSSGDTYTVNYADVGIADGVYHIPSRNFPQSIWLDGRQAYVEVMPATPEQAPFILAMPVPFYGDQTHILGDSIAEDDLPSIPYAPASEAQAVVRIGRIPPPYAVTSTLEGTVSLWDLQRGERLHEVANGTGEPSVFGAINAEATHLVWRDNANQTLYLLDFSTGEQVEIDQLDGAYAQWFFLTPGADVILAVNLDFVPHVFAWDVATGERFDLGPYRTCERPQPDMARLSADGSTLVIGCDTGLDVWRIP